MKKIINKIIVITLVICILISSSNLGLLVKAVMPKEEKVITENVDVDLSEIKNLNEEKDKRSEYSKTYQKENGMYEIKYYKEKIHYKHNGEYIEIDNSLYLKDNKYKNKSNSYDINLPSMLNSNEKIEINYQNYNIKIYYENINNTSGVLNSNINRNNKNLKDEIKYHINSKQTIEYIIKQDSIKENIILNEYIDDYSYSYYIDTTLNLKKENNKLYFYNQDNQVILYMDEYFMYDKNNNISYDIDYSVLEVDNDTYKINVIPSDDYLKNASYPVVIDPEINFMNSGFTGGINSVYLVDLETDTTTFLNDGSFRINNKDKDNPNDDTLAYLEFYMPSDYTVNVDDIVSSNGFMYAYLSLPTLNTSVTGMTNVNLELVDSLSDTSGIYIDKEKVLNNTSFDHKFNIYEAIKERINGFEDGAVSILFKLTIEGNSNSSATYSLYGNMSGTPVITIGYMDDSGLNEYYTYEALPMNDESNFYVAHNSGNLTYVYNTYSNETLININHVYNANLKDEISAYGKGFNINYHETLVDNTYSITLTKGDGSKTIYHSLDDTYTTFVAEDGSRSTLTKTTNGYEILEASNVLKVYNSSGLLIKIYQNKTDLENKYLTISYDTNNYISKITDSYDNVVNFHYEDDLLIALETNKQGISLETNEIDLVESKVILFTYEDNKLIKISKTFQYPMVYDYTNETLLEYNTNNHLSKVTKNNKGYTFEYDDINKLTKAKIYSTLFCNGDYLEFEYSNNGKKTTVSNSIGEKVNYSFDKYYHTISIEDSLGYTTFYKYEDIYYDEEGSLISDVNYNKNHKIITSSNRFKNVSNPINNHGFEVLTPNCVFGWNKDVTNSSSASIDTTEYLYGSKVLKLYKDDSGEAKVYQDIYVEENKTYIVSGYIKNTNDGTGAYIDVVGMSTNVLNVEKSANIVNSSSFSRYEYKFTASSNGWVRIYLVNSSNGEAYFDNIQVNTNYLDTRYNYLSDSSFEGNMTPWEVNNSSVIDRDSEVFDEDCGVYSLNIGINGTASQTINLTGTSGDIFVFGGYSYYYNYTGKLKVKLILFNEDGTESKEFIFDENDINAGYYMSKLEATKDYYQIRLEITNLSSSSEAIIDNMALYKEGYGLNISINNNGLVESEYNEITNNLAEFEYDENNNLTKKIVTLDTRTDVSEYSYNDKNELREIRNNNVTTSITRDSDGNITNVQNSNGTKTYDNGSTTYTEDGLFPKTYTDTIGNENTMTYNYLTGLIAYVVDEKGLETGYAYDEDRNLIGFVQGSDTRSIVYTYDEDGLLTSIENEGVTYTLTYNNYKDLKTVKVGDTLLLTNNYEAEDGISGTYTGTLNETIYSYGTVSFEYDEERRIKEIYYNNNKVLEYTYNDYGEIASYTDYLENETYYYNYDYQNRLISVKSTSGNDITYTYDEESYLISTTNDNGTDDYTYTNYEGDRYLTKEELSGKYTTTYTYSSDSFKQLEVISYYITTTSVDASYSYEEVSGKLTGRVLEVEYTGINGKTIRLEYTYDSDSNITKVLEYQNNVLVYEERNTYDIFNQLANQEIETEDSNILVAYNYDSRGNIINYDSCNVETQTTIDSYTFTYNNENELTQANINGIPYNITYNSAGQPNIYFNWNITYNMRSITELRNNESVINYTYNANGVRTSKRVETEGSITNIEYVLNGTNIIRETRTTGNTSEILEYYYDINNNIIGFTYNGVKYLYLKNLQNDNRNKFLYRNN